VKEVYNLKEKKNAIACVLPGSIAEEAGIEKGDILLSVNGEKVKDIFDYRFLIAEESLLLEVKKQDGELWEIEIDKDEYEDLGIDFETSMLDDAKSCTNKCVFCFIDQLPKGMRKTLYFKDDDSRLSFLTGNYVTLTNMSEDDIDRIIKYKMSPINVSIHTTNPDLRIFMLKNRFAGNVIPRVKRLVDAGITVNCQIVLCRGINDGKELDKSISELGELQPGIGSISIVPVGITKHRSNLETLIPFNRDSSEEVIQQVQKWQEAFLRKFGSRFVYLADEFYIMAEHEIPDYEEYEDFPQIENGVGLIAQLKFEFQEKLTNLKQYKRDQNRIISIATGVSAYSYIRDMALALENKSEKIKVNIYEIKNHFFGENVTVAGLLTGSDLVEQLKGKELGDELLISSSMLKADEEVLLDDYTIGMLEEQLGVKVTAVRSEGKDFVEKILGIDI
jgi:putative radical SAM enzyme (TIGR03279 family)